MAGAGSSHVPPVWALSKYAHWKLALEPGASPDLVPNKFASPLPMAINDNVPVVLV